MVPGTASTAAIAVGLTLAGSATVAKVRPASGAVVQPLRAGEPGDRPVSAQVARFHRRRN